MSELLTWDATYAIALALKEKFPGVDFEQLSLQMVYDFTLQLENFQDDPALANEGILKEIYQDWFEEMIHDNK